MNKLRRLIEQLPLEELEKLKKDLDEGNLIKIVNKRINQLSKISNKKCPVCGEVVTDNSYVLEFGDLLRKKAYFDGADCLNYFVETKLKKLKH